MLASFLKLKKSNTFKYYDPRSLDCRIDSTRETEEQGKRELKPECDGQSKKKTGTHIVEKSASTGWY